MARALWTGAMSFGLVSVPVRLESAVKSERPRFHLLHAKDESPVHYQRVCEREGKPVPWTEVVKGYEVGKGEHAVLTPEDFKRAALDRSETIDIMAFVDAGAIDARYYDSPYYLTPGKGGERAYVLLRETMRKAGKTAVALLVMRQAQHLAAIVPVDDALVLTTLRFAAEVAEAPTIELPRGAAIGKNEEALAKQLIEGFTDDWKPEQYHDRYSENLQAIIKTKTKRGALPRLTALAPEPPKGEVADLMERLRASLATKSPDRAADKRRAGAGRTTTPARKRTSPRRHRGAA
jgi:DNA end-binding protein Ku